ncbi:ribbon-helix-helix protein, CopG family [Acetobacter pasteurianus]
MNAVDAWAEANGVTRAEAIRRLIARGLEIEK